MVMQETEPKIIAFLCNWCAYAGADLAGVSRFQYPPNLRPVRVMCSGRVDPVFILEALMKGADGVLVAGCHIGECHYIDGNVHAENKIRLTQSLLDRAGIGGKRLRLAWVSAAEGRRFARVTTELVDTIKTLGPLDREALALPLKAVRRTLDGEKIRWMVGVQKELVEKGDVYDRPWTAEQYKPLLDRTADNEYQENLILNAMQQGCKTAQEIGAQTGLALTTISYLLADMEKTGTVEFSGFREERAEFITL
jgi:F420-non-reducing hydrogenase iron-sulfur subunit